MLDPPSLWPATLASTVALVGAGVQGAVGFGFALVAAPLLVQIDPRLVPGPLLLVAMALVALTAYRDRAGIDLSGLGWGLVGRLPGTALGALAIGAISEDHMALLVGGVVLAAVALTASHLHIRPTRWTLLGAGAVSGFMGTASSIGGPPLAVVYQHEAGARLRGTLAGYFLCGGIVSLLALGAIGRLGEAELTWAAALLPGTVAGFALSSRLAPVIDRGYTRPAVLGVSAIAGAVSLLRAAL